MLSFKQLIFVKIVSSSTYISIVWEVDYLPFITNVRNLQFCCQTVITKIDSVIRVLCCYLNNSFSSKYKTLLARMYVLVIYNFVVKKVFEFHFV